MSYQNWVLEYEASNYLREMSEDLLQERYDMLTYNLWSTGQHGEVTPPRDPINRRSLLRLIVHVCCEQSNRRGDGMISFDEETARSTASASYTPATLKIPFGGSPECFAKFGQRDHIKRSFDEGVFRIAPASSFNDASLNEAQRDNELMHWTRTPNEQMMVKFYGLDENGAEIEMPVRKQELLRGMTVSDFYVWCCGLGYDARLFSEFKAEAVIVIRNKQEFKRRFSEAVSKILPYSTMQDRSLVYYDPYTIHRNQLFPIFTKNIKYLHQNEYRFAWQAPAGDPLEPKYPVLGPLHDIAEFHEIS
ncbi:hypothetical protein ACQKJ1_23785 [Methylorubrum rhodesianum]|jgi:hypothetical protein|uniref:hypothetical protein n=2 Tax=Methylobacteriaceae TaxID=119045 RepID=UPI002BE6EB31|nr:hypothetical protein [Chthoniobacter sp.]